MKARKVYESTLNPYDKIGVMMAQEYGVDLAWDTTEDGLRVKQKSPDKVKTNKTKKDPFKTKNLGHKNQSKINESSTTQTLMAIRVELAEFLKGVVIPQSKGHVNNERDAALHLYDILKTRYKIGS